MTSEATPVAALVTSWNLRDPPREAERQKPARKLLGEGRRRLGSAESVTFYAHKLGALMAVAQLTIRGPLQVILLRRALDCLQLKHPLLRAHIVRNPLWKNFGKSTFSAPLSFETKGTAPIPLISIIDDDPEAVWRLLRRELSVPIGHGALPRLRVVMLQPAVDADLAQLIVSIDQTIADASSATLFARQLMEYLSDPLGVVSYKQGRIAGLRKAIEERAPKRPLADGDVYTPRLHLPTARLSRAFSWTAIERSRFTRGETEAVKTAAQTNRAKLLGWLTGAILKAIHERFRLPEMTCPSSVDLRRLARPTPPDDTFACYVDLLRTRHRICVPFPSLARDVSFKLIGALARDRAGASVIKFPSWRAVASEALPLVANRFRADGLVMTTTGEGKLARSFGPFVLEDIMPMVSQTRAGGGVFCIALARQQELELNFCYAADCLSADDADAMADRSFGILREPCKAEWSKVSGDTVEAERCESAVGRK